MSRATLASHVLELERLVAHRELQLLRAGGRKTPGGHLWLRARRRKLDQAQAALDRARTRLATHDQEITP